MRTDRRYDPRERGLADPSMWSLDNTIQRYAWGSRTALATLQGRPGPTPEPEAELWMGAHLRAPSRLRADGRTLSQAIEDDPEGMLGAAVARRFGPRLPFLLKVLAAAEPLSLQAHPDAARAREGFDAEDAAGIPRDAPHRRYADPWAKPELVCALGPFVALCGFRALEDTRALLDALAVPGLRALCEPLWIRPEPEGLAASVHALLTMADPAPLVRELVAAAEHPGPGGERWPRELEWIRRIAARHGGDRGVAVALLLELVELRRGEALFLSAGNLHCYLEGTAVEIMGASDNVLRGGLTPKHVDVPELLRVLDFHAGPVPIRRARPISEHEAIYDSPAPDFALSCIELPAGARWSAPVAGPELLLCVEGRVRLLADAEGPAAALELSAGESAFVGAATPSRSVQAELAATMFRATVGGGSITDPTD
jgi:mannose-6-phosphate isomerase